MSKKINWEEYDGQIIALLREELPVPEIASQINIGLTNVRRRVRELVGAYLPACRHSKQRPMPWDKPIITEDVYAWRFGFPLDDKA